MSTELVETSVDSLIVGSSLTHPIYDARGVMLLAEGAVVSSELLARLRQRVDGGSLKLHPEDVEAATLNAFEFEFRDELDPEIASELDAIIDGGLLSFTNSGPPASSQLVFHGRKAYDERHRENLILQHQSTSESLDSMMKEALKGGTIRGDQVVELAARHFTDIADDCDSVVSIASEARSQGLGHHALGVSLLAMAVAIELDMNEENVRTVGTAALVCDWGMTRVPSRIRNSNSFLGPVDRLAIQRHPIYTLDILERTPGIPRLVPLVCYQVHESPNGRGYPRGRRGESIHPLARIIRVADVYKSLVAERPHRAPLIPYFAMECVLRMAKRGDVDQPTAAALLRCLSLFPTGSIVALSDGSVAQVMRRNPDSYMEPFCRIIRDGDGRRAEPESEYFLPGDRGLGIAQAISAPGTGQISLNDRILDPAS